MTPNYPWYLSCVSMEPQSAHVWFISGCPLSGLMSPTMPTITFSSDFIPTFHHLLLLLHLPSLRLCELSYLTLTLTATNNLWWSMATQNLHKNILDFLYSYYWHFSTGFIDFDKKFHYQKQTWIDWIFYEEQIVTVFLATKIYHWDIILWM